MENKKIDTLYTLLERAEKEKDAEAVAALRWAIFELERSKQHLDNATNRLYYGIVPYHNIIMSVWSDCATLTRCADFYAFKDALCSSAHNHRRIAAGIMPELRRCVVGMGTITIALSLLLKKDTGRKKEIFFSRNFLG